MAFLKKINPQAKKEINTGFGVNALDYGGRFINKKGKANIEIKGVGFLTRISWYHSLLNLSLSRFFLFIFIFYISINLLFALIYFFIGVEHINVSSSLPTSEKFIEAFFFSCQTFTTVGYGNLSPKNIPANIIASIESLIGWLSLAVSTSLLYGKFAQPAAFLKFSKNAIIAPYKDITALMFRVAPYKNTSLIEAEAKVSLALKLKEEGKPINKFFELQLEYQTINTLTLSWTIVHPIDEKSPLFNFTHEDYKNIDGEIMVFLKAFDDMFSGVVVARTSYTFKEVVLGAKFKSMYYRSKKGEKTILDFEKLNLFHKTEIKIK